VTQPEFHDNHHNPIRQYADACQLGVQARETPGGIEVSVALGSATNNIAVYGSVAEHRRLIAAYAAALDEIEAARAENAAADTDHTAARAQAPTGPEAA
jgi:hypothetical protein